MSRPRVWTLRVAAAIITVGVGLALGSCVSERATTAAPVSACNVQLPAEAIGSVIVSVHDFAFTPAQIDIRAGTKVTWVNCGSAGNASHTSTSDTGVWDSGLLAPGQTYTRQFDNAGAFPFHCTPHPFMTGTVTVN
jgi:plastocyanin